MRKLIPVVCVALLASLVVAAPAQAVPLHDFLFTVGSREELPRPIGGDVEITPQDVGFFSAADDAYEILFDGNNDSGTFDDILPRDDGEYPKIDAISLVETHEFIDLPPIQGFDVCEDMTEPPCDEDIVTPMGYVLVMSFDREVDDLPILADPTDTDSGVPTDVDDSDLVIFNPETVGEGETTGAFILHLKGANIALRSSAEDIDAVEIVLLPDVCLLGPCGPVEGFVLISTTGSFTAHTPTGPTVRGKDEDVLRCDFSFFDFTELGQCELLSIAFDGSDSGLGSDGEDLDAFALNFFSDGIRAQRFTPSFTAYGSTTGSYRVEGDSGRDEDIATCSEGFDFDLCDPPGVEFVEFFDGSDHELDGDIKGIHTQLPFCSIFEPFDPEGCNVEPIP